MKIVMMLQAILAHWMKQMWTKRSALVESDDSDWLFEEAVPESTVESTGKSISIVVV